MKTVGDIGENALIAALVAEAPLGQEVRVGPGDDCAVVAAPAAGSAVLLKTDAVVEGVHFTAETPARRVGRKAMARVLSDMAAMGGVPKQALVTLLLPADTPVTWVKQAYAGLYGLAREHGVSVVGGETTRGRERVLSVALTGEAPEGRWAARSAGRAGDAILVTGVLGGSLKRHHLTFEPRLEQGRWLVHEAGVTTMMDLSDGLAKDLPRLAAASGCGFCVDWEKLPLRRGCSVEQAWGDGEDFELLFAVPAARVPALVAAWKERFRRLRVTCVGELVAAGQGQRGEPGGWDPFERPSGTPDAAPQRAGPTPPAPNP